MSFFTMFAALGTPQYGMREIARHRDSPEETSKLFWEIELLTVFTSLVCLAAWLVLCLVWTEYRPYLLALIPVLLGTRPTKMGRSNAQRRRQKEFTGSAGTGILQ